MHRWLGVAVLSVVVAACGPAGVPVTSTAGPVPTSAAPSRPASPSAPPSASAVTDIFESSRHRYRLEVPAGWTVNEYEGSWETLSEFSPGGEIPGEDAIATGDFGSFLVMNSMPIPSGMTAEEWSSAFEAIVAAGLPADCPGTTTPGTFAGEPATIVEQTCAGAFIVGRSLVHSGRGYYFTTKAPDADPVARAVVEQLVASIEFTD